MTRRAPTLAPALLFGAVLLAAPVAVAQTLNAPPPPPAGLSIDQLPPPTPATPAPPPAPGTVAIPPPVLPAPPNQPGVRLGALDKVTARISEIEVPLNTPVRFGTLSIVVRACSKTPPTEPPESTALVQIDDIRQDGVLERVFSAWMFASTPSVSALEHPVYDVWVVECTNASNAASSSAG